MDWLDLILSFLGGFGLFLFGMEYMGEGLQKAAGSRMKNILGALTQNRLLGVLVGAGVTALIQSSSATTVMVVGFVNVGLLSLRQAVGVIMGANIGTTITSWIVALGEWTTFLKPAVLAPIFIVVGVALIMFSKKAHLKSIGQILFGFGGLFLGLDMMSNAAKPLSKLESIKNLFLLLGSNPVLGVLTGAVVTAIIQSSSASVGILQALALAGLVPWGSAIYIILGQNIGTCITAILSSIGASINAKRAATIHFLFNLIGTIIFGMLAVILFNFAIPSLRNELIDVTQISIVHTIFNVLSTIILFPFGN
ncbi:MAG: Na/Pi symporter, partial [Candidatus Cellulosilyticum pullistercoris]|nr:Na/Pi symporter [Candidatus Cellulosilyticum pullistercoris]